jgi:hypothetical protein
MRNDHAYGVDLRWVNRDTIEVDYLTALNQRLPASQVVIAGHVVHIALRSGVRDPNAQPGGMLINLRQQREPTV